MSRFFPVPYKRLFYQKTINKIDGSRIVNIDNLTWKATSKPIHSYKDDSTLHANFQLLKSSSSFDLNNNRKIMFIRLE